MKDSRHPDFFDLEYIRSFLLQELGEEETNNFMQQLRDNKELRALVREEKLLLDAFQQKRKEELRTTIKSLAPKKELKTIKPLIPLWGWVTAGVAAILLLGVLVVSPTMKNTYLLSEFYPKEVINRTTMKGSRGIEERWTQAHSHYGDKEYQQAIELYETLEPATDKEVFEKALYLGRSYLNEGLPEKAITALSQSNKPEAQFHLALAYLKNGDEEKAKQLLTQMRTYKRANVLLEKLNKSPYFFQYWGD